MTTDREVAIYILRARAIDLLESVLATIWGLPLTTVLATASLTSDLRGMWLAPLGLIADLALRGAEMSHRSRTMLERFKVHYLDRFVGPLVEHRLETFVPPTMIETVTSVRSTPARVFVAKPGGDLAPGPLIAYQVLARPSYILLRDDPSLARGPRRFLLLHEVGHADVMSERAFSHGLATRHELVSMVVASAFLATNLLAFVTMLVCYYFARIPMRVWRRPERSRVFAEAWADRIAVDHLEDSEIAGLRTYIQRYPLVDPELGEEANKARNDMLLAHLSDRDDGRAPNLLRIHPPIPFGLFACGFLVGIGWVAGQADSKRMTVAAGTMAVAALSWFGWNAFAYGRTRRSVDLILDERLSS